MLELKPVLFTTKSNHIENGIGLSSSLERDRNRQGIPVQDILYELHPYEQVERL